MYKKIIGVLVLLASFSAFTMRDAKSANSTKDFKVTENVEMQNVKDSILDKFKGMTLAFRGNSDSRRPYMHYNEEDEDFSRDPNSYDSDREDESYYYDGCHGMGRYFSDEDFNSHHYNMRDRHFNHHNGFWRNHSSHMFSF